MFFSIDNIFLSSNNLLRFRLISFELSNATHIELDVYNLKGQYLTTIMGGMLQPGNHQFYWVPSNVSSDAYFIRVSDGKNSQFAKILYLK